jgi:hypothetical protein
MGTFARSVYFYSELGVEQELPRAGSALENPFVFDAAAQELKAHGRAGPGRIPRPTHRMQRRRVVDRPAALPAPALKQPQRAASRGAGA